LDWKTLKNRLLPPFSEAEREPPRDMLYVAADRPPWSTILSAGLQHALVALMFVVYSVIAGEAIGLEASVLRDFVAIGILIMGIGTVLNGLTTRLSAGHLLVNIPDPLTIGLFIAIAGSLGPQAAAAGIILMALMVALLGRFLPLLRTWFPAEISGIALLLLGVSLIAPGMERAAGLNLSDTGSLIDVDAVLIASATLATMVGLSVWSTGRLRILAMLIGTLVGLLLAIMVGAFGGSELSQVTAEPLFAIPGAHYRLAAPDWQLGAIVPYLLISLVVLVDSVGVGVTIDKMTHASWRRPDLAMIGRMLTGLGACNLLNGLTGTLGSALSSANLGLTHISGVAARIVGITAGLLLISLAFMPQVTRFMALMPRALVGAILLYTAAYMIVSGAELILSRLLDARRRATIGLSLVAGLAVFALPELTEGLSPQLAPLLGSSLMVGTLCAVLLNRLFRIGATQRSEILLDGPHPGRIASRHLEDQGAYWGGRREVFRRAETAVGEALEMLQRAAVLEGAPRLQTQFDECQLRLTLSYPGQAISLAAKPRLNLQSLLDDELDESALDAAMKAVSVSLIRNLADQVETTAEDGRARLRLQFEH
jgi:xanthine/uracil permease